MNSVLALASALLVARSSVNAFTLTQPLPTPALHCSSTQLLAAGGAPQYDKIQATLRQAERVGDGSVMLHIDTQEMVDYEPGHVIALEIKAESEEGNDETIDSKTQKDAADNGGWMRGPYTVSRSTEHTLDILIKEVGAKSKRFATAEAGTPLQFGGKFKVPILEGIDAETTKRVVLVSTGVGVGPCIGAIEMALSRGKGEPSFPPIDLIASYRTEEEVLYKDHLDKLQVQHEDKFAWRAIVTNKQGRLSSSTDNLKMLTDTKFHNVGVDGTHYHLIGNGQMVSEFKAGLEKAGVPEDKVTLEMYFNHKAEVDVDVVDRIADVVMKTVPAAVA
eukprot:CAMPEP_0181085648 /NCGR_PEP_ID=MMETSP1071-20121207/5338_1 /TAXON_ID=35127 /ORGANISM="Thalassiosira sp., Strain NH16" /LENGTH=332 /DNA_ID=CAMNT_0023167457 /DNA_START=68 /DNA_END=1066 /DNA_ORIENTATION=+